MRTYIKYLATLVAVGLGMSSCISDFENTEVDYPSQPFYGVFEARNLVDGVRYTSVVTEDENGSPLVYSIGEVHRKGGKIQPLFLTIAENAKYDQKVGVITGEAKSSYWGDGNNGVAPVPTQLSVAQSLNKGRFIGELLIGKGFGEKKFQGNLYRVAQLPTYKTTWMHYVKQVNEEGKEINVPDFMLKMNADVDSAVYTSDFMNEEAVGYSVQDGVLTFTQDGKPVAEASLNEKSQFVLTIGEKQIVLLPECSRVVPEKFEFLAEGVFSNGLLKPMPAQLYKGDQGSYCIKPWWRNEKGFIFKVDEETGAISYKKQVTNVDSKDLFGEAYGMITVSDAAKAIDDNFFNGATGKPLEKVSAGLYDKEQNVYVFNLVYRLEGIVAGLPKQAAFQVNP